MASDNEASCVSDPNFAVICSFLECFGKSCGIEYPDIKTLQKMIEDTHEVPQQLIDLHVKLLRKTRKSVHVEKWERALVKFCHTYSNQDGWELERFGYKKARISVKLRLLKVLLETQFDLNQKFKNEVNKQTASELRLEPLGRDKTGLAYWFQLDEDCNIRVYREDIDEESWELVANDREGVVKLINTLTDGEAGSLPINEDSNSLEISEKPIIDTGQVPASSPSVDEEQPVQENGNGSDSNAKSQGVVKNPSNQEAKIIKPAPAVETSNKKTTEAVVNNGVDDGENNESEGEDEGDEDEEEEDEEDEVEEEEDDEEEEEELSNDASTQNTEEDGSQDVPPVNSKPASNKLNPPINENYLNAKRKANQAATVCEKEIPKPSVIKANTIEVTPLKAIETPVITSPLKLVNTPEPKHFTTDLTASVTISAIKPSTHTDESKSRELTAGIKAHEKPSSKSSLPYHSSLDVTLNHGNISKFPLKPIDKLAANLVRMQSEKLEKPSASKLLEKIAENLARSSSSHATNVMSNNDDDKNKFPSDFSSRLNPVSVDKHPMVGSSRSSRGGIDLSTPRDWDNAIDHQQQQQRPVDFSGMDLSSRKQSKPIVDPLPSPGYRAPQDFHQFREMDLSTRKVREVKPDLPNLPYDSRMLRNHSMITDLSKRQMPFVGYDMPASVAYHNAAVARLSSKDEHRLPSYTILPDPSKLASMRSGAVKRALDETQQDMLKRFRADLSMGAMRGPIDKKAPPLGMGVRREDVVGPAIEEPLMMVQGEGSGSDCDAGNPEVSDAVEEPVVYFYGEGSGRDCDTGNPGEETSTDSGSKDSGNESKNGEECSEVSASISQSKVNTDNDNNDNTELANVSNRPETSSGSCKPLQLNNDCETESDITSNCQSISAETSESPRGKFKPTLGVQVIVKSPGCSAKRTSRWDVGRPDDKPECDSSISNEENISQESESCAVNDAGYQSTNDIRSSSEISGESKLETEAISSTTNQNTVESMTWISTTDSNSSAVTLPGNNLLPSVNETKEDVESTEQKMEVDVDTAKCVLEDEPPRFFFGPNCVSYTPSSAGKRDQDATSSSLNVKNDDKYVDNNNVKSIDIPPTAELATQPVSSSDMILPAPEKVSAKSPESTDNDNVNDSPLVTFSDNDIEDTLKSINDYLDEDSQDDKHPDNNSSKTSQVLPESSSTSVTFPEDERGAKVDDTPDKNDKKDDVEEDMCQVISKPESSTEAEVCSTSADDINDKPEEEVDSSVTGESKVESMDVSLEENSRSEDKDIDSNTNEQMNVDIEDQVESSTSEKVDFNPEDNEEHKVESSGESSRLIEAEEKDQTDALAVELEESEPQESSNAKVEVELNKSETKEATGESAVESTIPESVEKLSESLEEVSVEESPSAAAAVESSFLESSETEQPAAAAEAVESTVPELLDVSIKNDEPVAVESSIPESESSIPESSNVSIQSEEQSMVGSTVSSDKDLESIRDIEKTNDSNDAFNYNLSEDQSMSGDQDSNDPMIIDDRDNSMESSKNPGTNTESTLILNEKVKNTEAVVDSSEVVEPSTSACLGSNDDVDFASEKSGALESGIELSKAQYEDVLKDLGDEQPESKDCEAADSTTSKDASEFSESAETKSLLTSQTSLVANYGSDDSNDAGSDDVFVESQVEKEDKEVEESEALAEIEEAESKIVEPESKVPVPVEEAKDLPGTTTELEIRPTSSEDVKETEEKEELEVKPVEDSYSDNQTVESVKNIEDQTVDKEIEEIKTVEVIDSEILNEKLESIENSERRDELIAPKNSAQEVKPEDDENIQLENLTVQEVKPIASVDLEVQEKQIEQENSGVEIKSVELAADFVAEVKTVEDLAVKESKSRETAEQVAVGNKPIESEENPSTQVIRSSESAEDSMVHEAEIIEPVKESVVHDKPIESKNLINEEIQAIKPLEDLISEEIKPIEPVEDLMDKEIKSTEDSIIREIESPEYAIDQEKSVENSLSQEIKPMEDSTGPELISSEPEKDLTIEAVKLNATVESCSSVEAIKLNELVKENLPVQEIKVNEVAEKDLLLQESKLSEVQESELIEPIKQNLEKDVKSIEVEEDLKTEIKLDSISEHASNSENQQLSIKPVKIIEKESTVAEVKSIDLEESPTVTKSIVEQITNDLESTQESTSKEEITLGFKAKEIDSPVHLTIGEKSIELDNKPQINEPKDQDIRTEILDNKAAEECKPIEENTPKIVQDAHYAISKEPVSSNDFSQVNSNKDYHSLDKDEDDEEPIVQVCKRARTEPEELNKIVSTKSPTITPITENVINENKILSDNLLAEHPSESTPPLLVAAVMNADNDYNRTVDDKKAANALDNSVSSDLYIKDKASPELIDLDKNLSTDVGQKDSFDESVCKPSLVVNTVNADLTPENEKKETNKRTHVLMDHEDFPPLKLRPRTDLLREDSTFYNDMNDSPDHKPREVCHLLDLEKKDPEIKQSSVCNNVEEDDEIIEVPIENTTNVKVIDLTEPDDKLGYEDSDDSMGIDNECTYEPTEVDPLATTEDDVAKQIELDGLNVRVEPVNEVNKYDGWKLDSTETITLTPLKASRKRRNSAHESHSEDKGPKDVEEEENMGGKRMRLRGKRTPDFALRKSVENSRIETVSSEDEAETNKNKVEENQIGEVTAMEAAKPKAKTKGRKRRGFKNKRKVMPPKKKVETEKDPDIIEVPVESKTEEKKQTDENNQKKRKKKRMLLGLEIGIDIKPDVQATDGSDAPVRQSRRIAQLKIKEEADRRRIEEEALGEMKGKKDAADKKKRKKKAESEEEVVVVKEVEKESKKKKKRKKKKKENKFNEAKPWQSSSGSSSDDENDNEEEEDDIEEEIESEGSLLFKSDHEFSPESDLEKDEELEPMRRARTARKPESDVEEADDEYACQKCGKADHPEWILLCDTCDKGWHCSCLRPALMLIPEGDWFCPPCQHKVLVNKLRESLKNYDQMAKRHENEILRKKRLAYVGISLDNVLQKDGHRSHKIRQPHDDEDDEDDEDDSDDEDDDEERDHRGESSSSSSGSSSGSGSSESDSSSEESEPVYQLRERRCVNTSYKFNEYDDMINAAIQDEVEAVQGAGNQGRGKDISTIVNAEKEDAGKEAFSKKNDDDDDEDDRQSDKDSDKDYTVDKDDEEEDAEERRRAAARKAAAKKKHRKLNSLDISSEDDPESDEDFKGSDSEEEEDYEDQMDSSDDSSFTASRRRGGKKNHRPVRRSTRAARKTRYDEDFINDDSDDSDRPKRKKSKSMWEEESESEESDNSWRSRKKKSKASSFAKLKALSKSKAKKKKKRKRIIEPENKSDDDNNENDNEDENGNDNENENDNNIIGNEDKNDRERQRESENKSEMAVASASVGENVVENQLEHEPVGGEEEEEEEDEEEEEEDNDNDNENEEEDDKEGEKEQGDEEMEQEEIVQPVVQPVVEPAPVPSVPVHIPEPPVSVAPVVAPVYEENKMVIDEDKEENHNRQVPEVTKPEFTGEYPMQQEIQQQQQQPPLVEHEMDKKEKKRQKKSGIRRKIIYGGLSDDRPQQEEEEPLGRRTRGRKINYQVDIIMSDSEEELKKALRKTEESEDEFLVHDGEDMHDNDDKDSDSGDIYSPKKDGPKGKNKSPKNRRSKKSPASRKGLTDNGEPKQRKKPGPKPGSKNKPRSLTGMMSLEGGVMGDVPEGSLTGLGSADLADLDEEQLEQMMMEDEEYGRRQLELAAIEIAKNKKKEEREAKKLEKARQKALEILAAEQQRDPNAPEGPDGEAPKKKKRGRRSKAEILAEQMRRDSMGAAAGVMPGTMDPNIPLTVNPVLGTAMPPEVMMPGDMERPVEGHLPLITGPDGQLFNPDGTLVKPKRRGRGKGKKTLAMEAARAAEAAAKAAEAAGISLDSELKEDIPNVLPTPGSSTSGSAPSTPPANAVSSQGLPVTQSNPQSVYSQLPPSQQSSVITRMLQSQPVSNAPQSFTAAAAAMGQKYFGVPNTTGPMMPNPRSGYDMSPRGRIPSPYSTRQPGQPPMPPHFAAVRSGNPPPIMRMRVPGPAQLYHTPHHPMDPSPSGGGPISISSRDRASPLGAGPAMIPSSAGSPLAKGGPTPPPYVRGGPPISRFSDAQLAPRHQLPPFTSASPANHSLQQPSPPPNRPPGNFSPYHPQPPPNYHYGAYPPPAPMTTADDAAYQGSPYSAEHFSTSSENPAPPPPTIQAPPPAQTSQPPAPPTTHPTEPPHAHPLPVPVAHGPPGPGHPPGHPGHPPGHPGHPPGHPGHGKYDEEGTGEFGGLVSYFSSQREDDLDS